MPRNRPHSMYRSRNCPRFFLYVNHHCPGITLHTGTLTLHCKYSLPEVNCLDLGLMRDLHRQYYLPIYKPGEVRAFPSPVYFRVFVRALSNTGQKRESKKKRGNLSENISLQEVKPAVTFIEPKNCSQDTMPVPAYDLTKLQTQEAGSRL